MKIKSCKKWILLLPVIFLSVILGVMGYQRYAGAATNAVEVSKIDYENMELTLKMNGNAIVYYSTNKNTWYEADGAIAITVEDGSSGNEDATMTYDISWVSTGKTTIYFRGNVNTTTLPVVIPAYNKSFKVTFDKAAGTFDFENTQDVEVIRWRKTTDYLWRYVYADSSGIDLDKYSLVTGTGTTETPEIQTLDEFEQDIENLRVKGAKLIFQTVPVKRTPTDDGARPSKEVKVTIPAKRAAPTMKVNIKKLTMNTKAKYEWSTDRTTWTSCTGSNMELKDLAPNSLKATGATKTTLYFRSEATSTNCESKVAICEIPPRDAAPTTPIVLNVTPPASAGKTAKASIIFSNVPSEGYEYVIMKNGGQLDEKTAAWKTVKKAKTIKYTEKSLPAGAVIYVRVRGVNPNAKKNIDLQLPSQCFSMTVGAYPTASASTGNSSTTS